MFNHGTYPVFYILLGLAFLDPKHAQAAALGWDVHFFLASGISKVHIGGHAWCAASTMRQYLGFFLKVRDSHFDPKKENPFASKDRGAGNTNVASWGAWRYQRGLPPPPFADVAMIFPEVTRFILRHDFLVAGMGASATVMECIALPSVLFLSPGCRYIVRRVGFEPMQPQPCKPEPSPQSAPQ